MPALETLSPELTERMLRETMEGTAVKTGTSGSEIMRRRPTGAEDAVIWRPGFVRDVDKILHCPYYNRYSDKTQVFSLLRNDDVTRRSLHVQLVSRIARTIGRALNLNLDLIEAIALGHDIGHTPFAHSGEVYLDELYFRSAGRHFSHSIQSVRVLDGVFPLNLSLQVLNGIASHNGELELAVYEPVPMDSFEAFDAAMERCYLDSREVRKLMPSTLEGAVVRISDIIAYLGKDREDAARMNYVSETAYDHTLIGALNTEIVHNLMVNIIENSYGKPCIQMDADHFDALKIAKRDNYHRIYETEATRAKLDKTARPMMGEIYGQMLEDLRYGRKNSPVFTHHIDYISQRNYPREIPYTAVEPDQIVVDYIASMTDDYLIDLHRYLFPDSQYQVKYLGYFDIQQEESNV